MVETRFGRNYELFESYVIKNVLLIPNQFVLPHYRTFTAPLSAKEEGALDDRIVTLRELLRDARTEDAYLDREDLLLQQEEELIDKMEAQLDALKSKIVSCNCKYSPIPVT